MDDFVTGLSAQILVWPIISYFFGTVSLISLVVNTLILWTVPYTTMLGIIYLLISFLSEFLSSILIVPLYVLMMVFVEGVGFFYKLNIGYFNFKLSLYHLLVYYIFIFVLLNLKKIKGIRLKNH